LPYTARSAYFSWLDGRLPHKERKRVGQALFLLSRDDRNALHRFHELGDRTDRDAEAKATTALADALSLLMPPRRIPSGAVSTVPTPINEGQ
jgi:hypothetical protein